MGTDPAQNCAECPAIPEPNVWSPAKKFANVYAPSTGPNSTPQAAYKFRRKNVSTVPNINGGASVITGASPPRHSYFFTFLNSR